MNDSLLQAAKTVGELAKQRGILLSTAESCTGGLLSAALTHWPGSSCWFGRGYVCYQNEAKTNMLSVSSELIKTHGAVSEPVAAAMCEGAGDYAIAITGVAGPGESENKPAGMVCFAWRAGGTTTTDTCHFHGSRREVREQAAEHALSVMAKILKEVSPVK